MRERKQRAFSCVVVGLLFSLGVGEKAKETIELRPEGNQSAMQMPGEEY